MKEQTYNLTAVVRRDFEQTFDSTIKAKSRDEAEEKFMTVMQDYPGAHKVDGVSWLYLREQQVNEASPVSVQFYRKVAA